MAGGSPEAVFEELRRVLPRATVLAPASIPPRYRLDGLRPSRAVRLPPEGFPPGCVVKPRTVRDVVSLAAYASGHGIPLVPLGGSTGLMGGGLALRGAIILDMKSLARIRSIRTRDKTVEVEAGMVLGRLALAVARKGLHLGHDPWSQPKATVGGAIATDGLGYSGYLYGSMGDQVLGLEVVLADGSLVRTRPAVKSSTGLDLKELFIGTEGTLGIVTAATLQLFPSPRKRDLRGFSFPTFDAGFRALEEIYDGLGPWVMDYNEDFRMPGDALFTEDDPPTLRLGFAGPDRVVQASWATALPILRGHGARAEPRAVTSEFWRTRHDVIFRYDEVRPGVLQADEYLKGVKFDYVHVALPRSQVLGYRRWALRVVARLGIHVINVGLYTRPELVSMAFMAPLGRDPRAASRAMERAIDACLRRALDLGGSMEYVHGVGTKLAHLMGVEKGTGLEILRAVKQALDPLGILNPGKEGL